MDLFRRKKESLRVRRRSIVTSEMIPACFIGIFKLNLSSRPKQKQSERDCAGSSAFQLIGPPGTCQSPRHPETDGEWEQLSRPSKESPEGKQA